MHSAVRISLQKHFFEATNLSFNLFLLFFCFALLLFLLNFINVFECAFGFLVNIFAIYYLTLYFCETQRYLPDTMRPAIKPT